MSGGLIVGLDLGTSGVRSAVLDPRGAVVGTARGDYGSETGADAWWGAAVRCITQQVAALAADGIAPQDIEAIGVDGTSGSLVLTDAKLKPVTRPLMYNDAGFDAEAARIAAHAPASHISRGSNSALARVLHLVGEADGKARHLLHQADFVAAKLMGRGGLSDENNALKTGFDPDAGTWPNWLEALELPNDLLPEVRPAGAYGDDIDASVADQLELPKGLRVHLGTTDSTAAFLAAAPLEIGVAVTSLGTTLAVKMLSAQRIDAPEIGLYSHKLGQGWLVGGASNTGGGVLRSFFDPAQLAELSAQIDPEVASPLDYYPLARPGERFPTNDPNFPPRLLPRPDDDAAFLHGMLEGIARIEAQCYAKMAALGAPPLRQLFTAGGGAANATWTAIRQRHMGMTIDRAAHAEAAIGTARLIQQSG
ncbi:MAG: FGGY-family carbohydrate kinase [Pseudomonadota bacterium]